ncbi:hypothetical protein ACWEKR_35245 [Nocardia sp. NPDC004573]
MTFVESAPETVVRVRAAIRPNPSLRGAEVAVAAREDPRTVRHARSPAVADDVRRRLSSAAVGTRGAVASL